jgi:hypothetical protein
MNFINDTNAFYIISISHNIVADRVRHLGTRLRIGLGIGLGSGLGIELGIELGTGLGIELGLNLLGSGSACCCSRQ